MGEKIRKTIFYKDFGKSFIRKQPIRVKEKILWTLDVRIIKEYYDEKE
jgi:hypothetical protein